MPKSSVAKIAPAMSDQAVQAKTGKTWDEWFAILDRAGAKKMSHQEIVAQLVDHHSVGPWWQQMVTVTYEKARGLREDHQVSDGYQISRSRTLAVPVSELFKAWYDKRSRARWLQENGLIVRKSTADKSMRITWIDGKTSLEVNFCSKGQGKSQVSVQHSKLSDAAAAERMKSYWTESLDRLQTFLQT